jgi:hypothetical protein
MSSSVVSILATVSTLSTVSTVSTLLALPSELIAAILFLVPSTGGTLWCGARVRVLSPVLPTLRLVCKFFRDLIDTEATLLESNRVRWESERILHTLLVNEHDVTRRFPLLTATYLLHQRSALDCIRVCADDNVVLPSEVVDVACCVVRASSTPALGVYSPAWVWEWLMHDSVLSAHPQWTSILVNRFKVLDHVSISSNYINEHTSAFQAEAVVHACTMRPPSDCRIVMDVWTQCELEGETMPMGRVGNICELLRHCAKMDIPANERNAFVAWVAGELNTVLRAAGRQLVSADALVNQYGVVNRRSIPWRA